MPRILTAHLLPTIALAAAAAAAATSAPSASAQEPLPPDSAFHTVRGERHGVSFFARTRHPEVEYVAGDRLTFDRYHTVDVMYTWLRRWAERHPGIVDLYEVGKSFEGRPVLQVTLTNKSTGKATDKPAAFFEGARHSGEITASESVLWLIQHLVDGYGKDPRITRLLDSKAITLRPQNNPDGSNLYLYTAQSNRSTVRPHDTDRDGLFDEDPPEDLDGDGIIYSLRWRVTARDSGKGNATLDARDTTGRLMQTVPDGEGDWRVVTEGIDNDGDGKFNEDGIGGLDLHRNYPENWRPDTGGDRTGRGHTQFGAGEYPLSEIETRTVVLWLLANPNVSVVNSMDTAVPMHLRPPSTSYSADRMYPEDLRYYEYFDSLGMRITGYPWAGDVYNVYHTRNPIDRETGDSTRPSPLFGHGPDFGYFSYGAIWYGDELWNGGRMQDFNGDGALDEVDALAWDDRSNGGRGFREWMPFNHPTLGTVEIGGFRPKFFSQNGPPSELERFARNQALFNLEMAMHLPQLELGAVTVTRAGASGDTASYDVTVTFRNTGRLPTALKQAQLVKMVQEDRVVLDFDSTLTRRPNAKITIVSPSTRDKTIRTGWTEPGESETVVFRVNTVGLRGVKGTARVLSTRGGLLKSEFVLGSP